jgi:hypothetical protein
MDFPPFKYLAIHCLEQKKELEDKVTVVSNHMTQY